MGLSLSRIGTGVLLTVLHGSGSATVYTAFTMENGDKFFARSSLVIDSTAGKLTATQVGRITGGTSESSLEFRG